MNEKEASPSNAPVEPGFRISDLPLVGKERGREENGELPANYGADLLYVTARDPNSLFLYWDANWRRLFEQAGLTPQQVHLRVYREDGSLEGTRQINPFLEYCFVEVVRAGADYYCELGCFAGEKWICLLRSGKAATPQDRISDDLEARFATLPLHLSFQRMLDLFHEAQANPATLAESVGKLQEEARDLRSRMTNPEWERLVSRQRPDGSDGTGSSSSDLATLLEAALESRKPQAPTAEEVALWKKLRQELGESSWSGSSRFA